jgi:hypothetical protein
VVRLTLKREMRAVVKSTFYRPAQPHLKKSHL